MAAYAAALVKNMELSVRQGAERGASEGLESNSSPKQTERTLSWPIGGKGKYGTTVSLRGIIVNAFTLHF